MHVYWTKVLPLGLSAGSDPSLHKKPMIFGVIHGDVTTHACLFQRRAKPCFFKPLTESDAAKTSRFLLWELLRQAAPKLRWEMKYDV